MAKLTSSKELRIAAFKFKEASKLLEQAANILDGGVIEQSLPDMPEESVLMKPRGETRVQQVLNFLNENPGSSRSEILFKTGLPKGTIASVLGNKKFFEVRDGRWYAKKEE